jgi:transcriptional regulator GlxA family with amidase domain
MRIAVLTFEGFNELDSFVAAGLLNRMRGQGWQAEITAPSEWVTSMNGVRVRAQQPLEFANAADVVLFGSGIRTRDIAQDRSILDRLRLDPSRQLIGSQCSGALLMAKLGLLGKLPACTDLTTKPWVIEAGVEVLDQPFFASGNLATAGGCLSAPYLAAWVIAKLAGEDACATALHYVAPVGEKEAYMAHALGVVRPYL